MAFVSVGGSGEGGGFALPPPSMRSASNRERRQSLVALRRHSEAMIAAAAQQQQRKSLSMYGRGMSMDQAADSGTEGSGRRSVQLESIDESRRESVLLQREGSVMSIVSPSVHKMSLTTVLENNPKAAEDFPWTNSGDKKFDMLKAEYLELLEDLVGAEPEKRNWKGIALALLTICFVFLLVFIAVQVLTPEPVKTGSVDLTLQHVADPSLRPKRPHLQWLQESGAVAVESSTGDIEIYRGLEKALVESTSSITDQNNNLNKNNDQSDQEANGGGKANGNATSSSDHYYSRQTLITRDDLTQFGHTGPQVEWSLMPNKQSEKARGKRSKRDNNDNSSDKENDSMLLLVASPSSKSPWSTAPSDSLKKCTVIDTQSLTLKKSLDGDHRLCKWLQPKDDTAAPAIIVVDDNNNVRIETLSGDTNANKLNDQEADEHNNYGMPDPLYRDAVWRNGDREEVEKSDLDALWLSKNQKSALFAGFHYSPDTTAIVDIMDYSATTTTIKHIHYPKRSDPIPAVSLHWLPPTSASSLTSTKALTVPTKDGQNEFTEKYLMCVQWVSDSRVKTDWLDRMLKKRYSYLHTLNSNSRIDTIQLSEGDIETPISRRYCSKLRSETEQSVSGVNGDAIYDVTPRHSSSGTFLHLIRTYRESAGVGQFLTTGSFDVHEIVAVTDTHVYILAPLENKPTTRHLFSVSQAQVQEASNNGGGSSKSHLKTCVTCDVTTSAECNFYSVPSVSPDLKWVELRCLGPDVPKTILISLEPPSSRQSDSVGDNLEDTETQKDAPMTSGNRKEKRKMIKITADEQLLRQLNKLKLADKQFIHVEDIPVMLIKPGIVDVNHQYPLVLYLDTHPQKQSVVSKWEFSYLDYIASTHKIFVAKVDTRGSQGYGVDFMSSTRSEQQSLGTGGRPGEIEAKGIKKVLEHLVAEEIVNPYRISLLALEYGAYVGMEVAKMGNGGGSGGGGSGDLVQCMAMVRPVTNLSNWDAFSAQSKLPFSVTGLTSQGRRSFSDDLVFVERSEALRGVSSPLVVAGLTDHTPVLFQHSAQLINQLTHTNIPFHSQIYTQLEPNTADVLQNSHVIQELTTYLTQCLMRQSSSSSSESEEE
ncbi:dipeptidyl peptidase 4-like isoform X3 [Convolutriloba macropyga]|uniref:dipeptidyl peptidase 4-like isoform X3 n=1 Tax=Convolutriloba macropyga TaxID=536237 RepID=UPI003F521CD1